MKVRRIACLVGLVTLGGYFVACSSDETTPNGTDGGTGGSEEAGGSAGKAGSAGKGGSGGGSAGSAGKAGGGGTAGKGGSAGSAGKAGSAGSAGDSGTPEGGGNDGGNPSIKITDPMNGEHISKDAEYTMFPKIPIQLKISNFTVKAPNSANCPAGSCGHVHINVDGNACNASGVPYNTAVTSGTTGTIDLSLCPSVAGVHTVTATLHNNDHSDVSLVDGGPVVGDEILITAVVGDAGTKDGG